MKQVTYKLGGQTHAGFLFDDSIVISAKNGETVPGHLIEELNIEEEWRDLEGAVLQKEKKARLEKNYCIKRIMPKDAAKPYAVWDKTNSNYLFKNKSVLTFSSEKKADEFLRKMGERP